MICILDLTYTVYVTNIEYVNKIVREEMLAFCRIQKTTTMGDLAGWVSTGSGQPTTNIYRFRDYVEQLVVGEVPDKKPYVYMEVSSSINPSQPQPPLSGTRTKQNCIGNESEANLCEP